MLNFSYTRALLRLELKVRGRGLGLSGLDYITGSITFVRITVNSKQFCVTCELYIG